MWQDAGFLSGKPDIQSALRQLNHFMKALPARYEQFSKEELIKKASPEKWCRQEILGHLIDSAVNNLKRFTDIQILPQPYIVQPYQQHELVIVNDYINLPLEHLLSLWQLLNQQIMYVVENIPAEILHYAVNPQYNDAEMKSLGWIICDYVAHMEHHWKQLA